MNLADVRGVDTSGLGDLATSLASRASSFEEARAQFAKITQFPGWQGAAKDAAASSFQNTDKSLLDDVARVSAVHQAAFELASDFQQLQTRLRELEQQAASIGAKLGDDGKVMFQDGAHPDDAQRHRAVVIGDAAYELVLDADRLDQKAGEVLKKAASGEIAAAGTGNETTAALAGAAQGTLGVAEPPKGENGKPVSPDFNTAWWNDLTKEQRQWVQSMHPEWVGNLDGVPSSARDEANRTMLPGDIARLQAEVDRLQKQKDNEFGHGTFSNTDSDLWYAQRRLEGAKAVQRALNDNPGAKLLVLDPDYGERGRAAIALGDPDTADHIAVTAPGVNSSPEHSIGGMTREAGDLKAETEQVLKNNGHGNETVSTIAWVGYEPPQAQIDATHMNPFGDGFDNVGPGGVLDEPGGASEVSSEAKAKVGAANLSSFYEGLSAAWHPESGDSGTSPHITALGHSYGSLTTSLALQQTSSGIVENAVFYGSPGLNLDSANQLPVPVGHAYDMQAPDDPIQKVPDYTGRYGANPTEIPGFTQLSAQAGDTTGDAAPGTTVHHDGASGHSDYPRSSNGQLRMPGYNMSVIVAGMTGQDGRPDLTVKGK
ncbi:MAG: alpha/beta hydrolase [Segniliparus sp.]|uniref:alpha/beta hydrolase n=1 Tax=Segniliparus sp. TaxID=2804064 RepID=UPI003F34A8EC